MLRVQVLNSSHIFKGISLQETEIEKNDKNEDGTNWFFMYGASYSRVEIDLLSGELNVLELHQSFDIGDPVNLGIELGQIEGNKY